MISPCLAVIFIVEDILKGDLFQHERVAQDKIIFCSNYSPWLPGSFSPVSFLVMCRLLPHSLSIQQGQGPVTCGRNVGSSLQLGEQLEDLSTIVFET